MGKSFKFNAKHKFQHVPNQEELEDRDWKHIKAKQKQKTRSPSNKELRGHFNQQHIWPLTDTKQKGRRKI